MTETVVSIILSTGLPFNVNEQRTCDVCDSICRKKEREKDREIERERERREGERTVMSSTTTSTFTRDFGTNHAGVALVECPLALLCASVSGSLLLSRGEVSHGRRPKLQ